MPDMPDFDIHPGTGPSEQFRARLRKQLIAEAAHKDARPDAGTRDDTGTPVYHHATVVDEYTGLAAIVVDIEPIDEPTVIRNMRAVHMMRGDRYTL